MKIKIDVYKKLFEDTGVKNFFDNIDLRFSSPSTSPRGAVCLRFARGRRREVEAFIWETIVQSVKGGVSNIKEEIIW